MAHTTKEAPLTQEEIETASNTNLVDFLQSQGYKIDKRGNSHFYTHDGNNSLAIFGNNNHMFKHFATGQVGNAITFCREYLGMQFVQAVKALNGGRFIAAQPVVAQSKPPPKQKEPFEPPQKSSDNKQLAGYLLSERKLNLQVVKHFAKTGSIYQTKEMSASGKEFSNLAFALKNFKGEEVGAIKRSFTKDGFKGNHKNSNTDFGFNHAGNSGKLFVFESPIDMLSYISFMENSKKPWQQDSFLALGGVHTKSLASFLQENKNTNQVYLCQDNDVAGIDSRINSVKLLESVEFKGKVTCHLPKSKDWNEDLQKNIRSTKMVASKTQALEAYKSSLTEKVADKAVAR